MYHVNEFTDQFKMYKLEDAESGSSITVCPERGGILTEFCVKGNNILYLDKSTFYDPKANIRGGIPILFPICGQLTNGEYTLNGVTYQMRNHGLARIHPWTVTRTHSDEQSASITLKLSSTSETEKSFPFSFELAFTYVLEGNKLTIHQEYHNRADTKMPIYAGFHPYFKTGVKTLQYQTDAKKYLDYNDMQTKPYTGSLNLDTMVESAVFLDAKRQKIAFTIPETQARIHMEYEKEFKYIVLWSVHSKNFVCVEPWMAMNDEMNRKQELPHIQPGSVLRTNVSIYAE